MSCSCNPTFVYVMPLLKGVHIVLAITILRISQKANTRLRDTAHWLLPDVKASSRNPVCLMADEFCTPPQPRSAETRRETYVMSPFDLYSRNNLVMFPPPLADGVKCKCAPKTARALLPTMAAAAAAAHEILPGRIFERRRRRLSSVREGRKHQSTAKSSRNANFPADRTSMHTRGHACRSTKQTAVSPQERKLLNAQNALA